jgi:hypothetical protein
VWAAAIRRKRAREKSKGITLMNPRIVLATAAALATVVSSGVAQTLMQPNRSPQAKTPPPVATKSHRSEHLKTCDAYGAGFRNIPGTDACIKIGGGVTVDVGR